MNRGLPRIIPSPAILLVAAAIASDIFPSFTLSIGGVKTIGTVALVVILFDGGAAIGLERLRPVAAPVAALGVPGTFATAGLLALFAHTAFAFGWVTSGLLGAALAPTDPAVMFSVLGGNEIGGRSGTLLEAESGANDPVGIALMIGLIELATHANETFWIVVRVFCEQMGVGLAVGVLGGVAMRRLPTALTLPAAFGLYLAAASAHGSGFLAVFVAGLVAGDARVGGRRLEHALAKLAETVVFVALGLTVEIGALTTGRWVEGIAFAGFAALVARPLAIGPLLAPSSLRTGEVLFVMWGGLKGAVPILLAAFAVSRHVPDAKEIYELVFVVVLASVVVQGGTISFAARRLGIPMGATPRA